MPPSGSSEQPGSLAGGERRFGGGGVVDCNANSGGWLEFHAAHPHDGSSSLTGAAGQLQHRPERTAGAGNAQTLQHFLHFAGSAGVAQADAVAGLPTAQDGVGGGVGLRRIGSVDPQGQAECGSVNFAGDGNRMDGRRIPCPAGGRGCREAEFARAALGAEAVSQLQALAGAAGEGQGAQSLGGGEIGCGAELLGGTAQQAALQGDRQSGQAGDVDGQRRRERVCPAASAHWAATQQQLGRNAGQFGLPPGFLVAGQICHLRQVLAQAWVPFLEQRQQLAADAVAGEGGVAVGGVFAPGLVQVIEEGLYFGACGLEQRTEDAALGKFNEGMDAGKAFGPCAPQEFGEHCFGLVVARVGGGHSVERNFGQELSKPRVAEAAGGFFNGFAVGLGFGFCVHAGFVEGEFELRGQGAGKGEVGVGFFPAQAVMEMGGMQHQSELAAAAGEGAQQGYGIGSAGEADSDAEAGAEERGVNGELGAHQRMIARWANAPRGIRGLPPEAQKQRRAREASLFGPGFKECLTFGRCVQMISRFDTIRPIMARTIPGGFMRSSGFNHLILALALTFPSIALSAQTATDATATTIQVPRLIRISGILAQPSGAAGISGAVDMAFALYAEEAGGEPLWQETQRVEVDATGHYSALLGFTQPEGLPVELFKSAQAQWLGVARQGEAEQPRIMLASVPFALKAGDAETLGGKPASAFAPAVPLDIGSKGAPSQNAGGSESPDFSKAHPLTITGGGNAEYLPMWTSATALASSPVYENKTTHNLGIGTTAPTAALEVANNTEAPVLAQTSGKNLAAIQGTNVGATGTGAGVYGASSTPTGSGVYGTESGSAAVGVWGVSSATSGNGNGVYGSAASPGSYAAGVWGHSSAGGGNGTVGSCAGTDGCTGVWGYSSGTSGSGWGVYGSSLTGPGVAGVTSASGGDALVGKNKATSGYSNGLYVDTDSSEGVGAYIDNAAGGYILVGTVDNNGVHKFDVDGEGDGNFAGNLHVSGNLSKAGGSFKIDDPIDPANKFLYHSFVESPDMMNVYNGNIATDGNGLATVVLPDYFEALNRDFRYQLTVMGQFAQAIVDQEMAGNRFVIRTSKPNVKVSWQVTGIRQDPWANAHRIPNEETKPASDRGYYLHPELYGARQDRSIGARNATPSPETLHPDHNPAKQAVPSASRAKE